MISFEVLGEGERTVLLGHNLFTDREVWRAPAERLAKRFRVVLVDHRGHGASPCDGPYAISDVASDLVAVLDEVGAGQADLVGVSLGSQAAIDVALRVPQRVGRLVLCAPTGRAAQVPDRVQAALFGPVVRTIGLVRPLADAAMSVLYGATYRASHLEEVETRIASVRAMPRAHVAWGLRCWATRPATLDRVGALRLPVLLVAGEEDVACPPHHAEELARRLPNAHVEHVRAGHTVPEEQPERIADLLDAFLA